LYAGRESYIVTSSKNKCHDVTDIDMSVLPKPSLFNEDYSQICCVTSIAKE